MANENGWGDGVLNNDIGWGQGSDNEIGWGSIYALSESGLTALESNATPLLLDLYPDASAAYSVRKLRTSYAGSALRVRRSGDNAEQDIGFVGVDLDSASLLTFVGAGNGFVSVVYDQSLVQANVTQTVAANQRQIVSSGVLLVNNFKAALPATGTSTQYNSVGRLYNLETPNLWFFGVQGVLSGSASFPYILASNPAGQGALILSNGSTEQLRVATVRSGGTSVANLGSSGNLVGQKLLSFKADRTTIEAWLNGASQGTTADNNSDFTTFTNSAIWGQDELNTRTLTGPAQELIIYESDQSANRAAIEADINLYYSIY